MSREITWTAKLPEGGKREVRVAVAHGSLKWQFKRSDAERWDYDSPATQQDWDTLEDILARRAARGRKVAFIPSVKRLRLKAGF